MASITQNLSLRDEKNMITILVVIEHHVELLTEFLRETRSVLAERFRYYEVIVLDNGSEDGSAEVLTSELERIENLRWIRLAKQRNLEIAISAGLEHCIGDCVVVMNPALDPPHEIPRVVDAVLEGNDVVIARRKPSAVAQPWARKLASRWASRVLGHPVETEGTYFRGMRRGVVVSLNKIKNRRRYLGYFHTLMGFKHVELMVESQPAQTQSRGALQSTAQILDLVISNSPLPLRCATYLSLAGAAGSLVYLAYVLLIAMLKRSVVEGWTTTTFIMASMFFCMFTVLGILSEYIARILEESQQRPLYFVELDRTSCVSDVRSIESLNVL